MSNQYYTLYMEHCIEVERMMEQYHGTYEDAKKLKGAVASELLKQEISKYLIENNKPFKTSAVNSFIAGSKFEYDLLIVKEHSKPYMELIYRPEDVVAIIESKVNGIFHPDKDTDSIARAANRAMEINSNIGVGYITISENVPVNDYNRKGESTVKHWDSTIEQLNTKISGNKVIYAVTLHQRQGKKLYDEGSDTEFPDFIENLIGNPS